MSLSEDDRRRIEEEERFRAEVRLRLEVAGQKQREPQRHTAEQELPKPKQRMLGWLEEIKKPEDFRRVPLGRIVWDLFKVSLLTTVLVWFASLAPGPIGMVFFIVLLLIGLLWMAAWYFLPALVAYHRHNDAVGAITVVTAFFGWTFIGWVVALAWAFRR